MVKQKLKRELFFDALFRFALISFSYTHDFFTLLSAIYFVE